MDKSSNCDGVEVFATGITSDECPNSGSFGITSSQNDSDSITQSLDGNIKSVLLDKGKTSSVGGEDSVRSISTAGSCKDDRDGVELPIVFTGLDVIGTAGVCCALSL